MRDRWFALAASLALVGLASRAAAAPEGEPWPGEPIVISPRPPGPMVRVCGDRRPVCVHLGRDASPDDAAGWVAVLETAWTGLVDVLGLPAPRGDAAAGGGPELDVYLTRGATRPPFPGVEVLADAPLPAEPDAATAFARIDADAAGGPCVRANLAARAVAGALLLGVEPAEGRGMRDGTAAYLAELVAPCPATSAPLVDDAQLHPERATLARRALPGAPFLFAWWLDGTLSASPGALPVALRATTRQRTPADSYAWHDEPDVLDGLRGALAARGNLRVPDVWIDFAIARAFLGDRDDGAHWVDGAWPAGAGRVRFDWSIAATSLPRRLAAARPVEPTGASYVWVNLEGAPAGTRIGMRAEWEDPVVFRWAAVRVDRDGREASRVVLPWQERGTSCEATIDLLDGARGVLLVGTNVGDPSVSQPYDLEAGPFEPHAWTVTLARQ